MVHQYPSDTLAPNVLHQHITSYIPELGQIADIDFRMLFNLDSANLQPEHWQMLARKIFECQGDYDGFVIIHGTDSMSYTAAALSFMLKNLSKPVILTGSQRPLAEIRNDARTNLINAVELATHRIPEVSIFFGTTLLRGNRAAKISSTGYGAFSSPNYPPLATVGLEVEILKNHLPIPKSPMRLKDKIANEVFSINFFPGLRPEAFSPLLESDVRAIVLNGLGMGNMASEQRSMVPVVQALTAAGKLVVVTSQSRHGKVDLSRYENGLRIAEAGAIGSGDMTSETTIVKLMHLLGNCVSDLNRIRNKMNTSLAGEITTK